MYDAHWQQKLPTPHTQTVMWNKIQIKIPMHIKSIIILIFVCLPVSQLCAQYKIEGNLNLDNKWQKRIFFSALDEWDYIHAIGESMILKETAIDENGNFSFNGDELPNPDGLYRLHIIEQGRPIASLNRGDGYSNYINFVFSNEDSLFIDCGSNKKLFVNCEIQSTLSHNTDFLELNSRIESFQAKIDSSKTERLTALNEEKLESYIKNYIENSSSPLGKLVALQAISRSTNNWNEYAKQVSSSLKSPTISQKYHNSFRGHILANHKEDQPVAEKYNFALWASVFLNILLSLLLFKLLAAKNRLNRMNTPAAIQESPRKYSREKLTKKENEVLDLILEGKTNQEIANQLFVELSTIKTHVNNVYRKTGIHNRDELFKAFTYEK